VCDDGYMGEHCEIEATCALDPVFAHVESPALVATFFATGKTACEDNGVMGEDKCLFGCEEEYYLIARTEGLCTADTGGPTASYKGMHAECHRCTPMAKCLGKLTCMSKHDSQCWNNNCVRGYVGPTCQPCPAGTVYDDNENECVACAAGKFSELDGMDECTNCPVGNFAPLTGSTECVICDAGRFMAETGAEACDPCPENTIMQDQGATECVSCPDQTWASQGTTECHGCDEVYACEGEVTCTMAGNSKCTDCKDGYFIAGDGKCALCTQIDHCGKGLSHCSTAEDSVCLNCVGTHYFGDQCTPCTEIEFCVRETCTSTEDGLCEVCEEGYHVEGTICVKTPPPFDEVCFTRGKYADDGKGRNPLTPESNQYNAELITVPDNTGRTAPTYRNCQYQCKMEKWCFLFSWSSESLECRLQASDAGCGSAECEESAFKKVNDDGKNGQETLDPAWVAGPKSCVRATCDTMECPAGWGHDMMYMYRKGSIIKCATEVCDPEIDAETCCEPASCAAYKCPPYYINKEGCEYVDGQEKCWDSFEPDKLVHCTNAEGQTYDEVVKSISGDDALGQFEGACTKEDDLDTCCNGKATCDSLDCGHGWTHMTDGLHISKKACEQVVCTIENDRDYCCDELATCFADFTCPVNSKAVDSEGNVRFIDFLPLQTAETLYCGAKICKEEDRDVCCAQRAECESFECPDGYAQSAWAVKTQIACVGYVCTNEADLDRCCFPVVTCDTMISTSDSDVCPSTHEPKEGLSAIDCASNAGRCDVRVDLDTCCNPRETCDEMRPILFDCGAINLRFGEMMPPRGNADPVACDGECLMELCETADPTCAWTTGPPGMWHKYLGGVDSDNQPIGSGACGYKECHREWDGCICPQGLDQWGETEQMRNGFFPPGTDDQKEAWGFTGEIWDAQCLAAEPWSGMGKSEKCLDGSVAIEGATEVYCQGTACVFADDADTCCEERQTCNHILSPKDGFALKPNAKEIQCVGSTCDTDVDTEACCDARQPCSENTCLPGYMPRHEEGLLCANGVCDQFDDNEVCCHACDAGKSSALGEECAECAIGTFSAEGYERTASSYCEDCPQGKYSNPGMDHCLDCNPIFACSSKANLALTLEELGVKAVTHEADYGDASSSMSDFTGEDGSFIAGVAEPGRRLQSGVEYDEGAVSCSNGDDAICTACHIGYWGSGTNTCHKCEILENCQFRPGKELGPHCTNDDDAVCGQCKDGFFGDRCTGCTEIVGCKVGATTCTTPEDGSYSDCSDGFFVDGGACSACTVIDNCLDTVCTEVGASTCHGCSAGFFAAGATCAPLEYVDNKWVYTIGGQ